MSGTTLEKFSYDNKIVKFFGAATMIWGLAGMLIGLLAATQLFLPEANLGNPLYDLWSNKAASYQRCDFGLCGQCNL